VDPTQRPARSFQPRRRGLSAVKAERYERLAVEHCLPLEGAALDLAEVFRPGADVVLDIGFGGGEGLVAMAELRPDECILGVEVHTPGVAAVLEAIDDHGWSHVRVVEGDVLDLLPRLSLQSFSGIRLWFPDPWPKNKQRHRRIVRPNVVATWTDLLRVGGTLHIATDIADYAVHTELTVADEPRLAGGRVPRPDWRPFTRFERRGRVEGRDAVDLMYVRTT